eukprot:m.337373 g.337373  ORF g.337373 m.337373 type:complete len:62 (+) comp117480_c0_seq1:171-356(+)
MWLWTVPYNFIVVVMAVLCDLIRMWALRCNNHVVAGDAVVGGCNLIQVVLCNLSNFLAVAI